MRTLSRFLSLGLCTLALALAGINDGVGDIKVGLGKNPPGKIVALATTDSTGTVRFRITEPGTYTIELFNPLGGTTSLPAGAANATIKLQGQASKAIKTQGVGQLKLPTMDRAGMLATGQIVMSADPQRVRLEHPGITFTQSGRSHVETIEVTEPTDLMLRLTDATPDAAQPTLQGLPEYLNFVAIEGGPSPLSRDMSAVASVRGITADWVPANGASLRVVDASQPNSAVYRVIPATQSLRPGFYSGNINFRGPDGTVLDETVPVYIRILPRESRLPPIAERHTYWAPAGNATINVLNPNPVSETIRLENPNPRDGWGVQLPPSITLGPGQAMEMRVTVDRTALTARTETPKELRLVSASGASTPVYLLMQLRQVTAGEAATCRATKLFPMFAQVFQSGANELGNNIVVEVRDDCNRVRGDATGKVTDESTAQAKAVSTQGVGVPPSKAVTKGSIMNLVAWTPPTDNEPAIEGTVGSLAISGAELQDLAEGDKPVVLEEIVNATSGEPSALTPGMAAYLKLGYTAPPVPPAVEMSKCGNCFQTSIGGVEVDVFRAGADGVVFVVPEIPNPQGKAVKVEGLPNKVKALAVSIAPSSPAVETAPDGTVVLLKHANLEDPGDDYTANGNAPPTAGDLVSMYVTGLGSATENDIQILVNGALASVTKKITCPQSGTPYCKPSPPIIIVNGSRLFFTMPEVASGDDSTEGAASIQVAALGVTSNIGVTSTIKFNQLPPRFRVITSPVGLTVQVNGSAFTYNTPASGTFPLNLFTFFPDANGNANLDVVPDKQPDSGNPLRRWDFDNWSIGGPRQQTVKIANYQTIGATFRAMYKITVSGATVASKAADDFYPPGTSLTLTATCPTGQVLDTYEVETRSTATGNLWIKYNTAGPTIGFNTPAIVTTKCKAGTTSGPLTPFNFNTSPASIGAFVGANGVGQGQNFYANSLTPGPIVIVADAGPITSNGVQYTFDTWRQGATVVPSSPSGSASITVPTTTAVQIYTAHYKATAYQITLVNNGCAAFTTVPALGANGFLPAGTAITGINITGTLQDIAFELLDIATGQTVNFTRATLTGFASVLPVGPTRITARCQSTNNINVTVITNPPNVQAEVGIANAKTAGLHQASLPASSAQTLTAQDPFLGTDGNYYRFNNWTPAGPGVTLPATGNIIYTANYQLTGYQVDASGCGITVGPAARQISANPLVFSTGGTLTLGATPPSGQVFQNFIVSPLVGGGTTTTYNTNPANIPFTGPVKIVANCGAATAVPITLISAPQASGPTLTLTFTGTSGTPITSGPAAGPRSINIPGGTTAGSLTLQAQPQFVGSGTGYNFNNFTPGVPAGNPAVVAAIPTTATTYTANYTPACHVLTLEPTPVAGGTATLNPAAGNVAGFPANCYAPNTVVTLTSQPATGYSHNSFGGDVTGTSQTTTTVTMNGPKNVKVFFDTVVNHAVTVTTSPTGLTFAVDGTPSTTPVSVQWPALSIHKLEVTTPQLLAGSYYAFNRWTTAAGTVSNLAVYPNASVSKPENYTGVFDVLCHVLTVNATGGTVTRNPATGVSSALANCYAPGTQVTLTAAGTGTNTLTGWSGDATGTTPTVTVTMNGPKTVTATFGAPTSIPITLVSDPAAGTLLAISYTPTSGAQSNSGLGAGPRTLNIPGNGTGTLTLQANPYFVAANTGYSLTNFTPGNLTGNTVNITPPPTTATTYTANFALACYMLAVNAAPASGGTVSVSPAASVTGFTNCYAPGTTVTLTANPATGQTLSGWTGATPGTGNTATVVMSQPRTVTANFGVPTTVAVIVNTTPPGLLIRVDNVQLTAPQTFNWTAGSSHSLAVVTPQAGATGVRQAWLSWSQGGAQAQTITTPNAPVTYTANFRTQYLVTTGTIPAFTGDLRVNTNPAPSDNYFDAGSSVSFTAAGTGNGAYSFGAWQGAITSSANPASLTINAPVTVTAVFDRALGVGGSINNRFPQGTNGYLHRLTLQPNVAVTNMIVNTVQVAVVNGTGSVANTTTLPINVGTVAANAQSTSMDITATIPTSVTMWTLTLSGSAVNAAGRTQPWTAIWTVQR